MALAWATQNHMRSNEIFCLAAIDDDQTAWEQRRQRPTITSTPRLGATTNLEEWGGRLPGEGEMITRSTLVEQLREYQVRSQHKRSALGIFSPKPQITTRRDVLVALSWAFLFCLLVISSYLTLHFRLSRLSAVILLLGILLPVRLKIFRHRKLAKKRERRLLLPLSM